MSYEKPVKDRNYTEGRRHGSPLTCANCRRPITDDEPAVVWDGLHVSAEAFEGQLTPIAKLATQTNPSIWTERYGDYLLTLAWHTHCAVYFGGHLVKDGLNDNTVSSTLRNVEKNKHGLQK